MESKFQYVINEQLKWLSSIIFQNGEFVMHNVPSNNAYKIVPYFSNIAGIALLEDSKYFSLLKKYLKWYLNHLNSPDKYGVFGTIYDYRLKTNGELVSVQDYDSNDSYPATFLTLCSKYLNAAGDEQFFLTNKNKVGLVLASLLTTYDADYLTWAKPNYKIKYLMDNCEVYEGLSSALDLYKNFYNDVETSSKLNIFLKQMHNSINKKFWSNEGFYYYQMDSNDKKSAPNIKKFYPDASCQLFPILNSVISFEDERAKTIYNNFKNNFPNPESILAADAFPNVYTAYVSILMNDYDRASNFIDYYQNIYIKNNNKWPWYSVEASYFIRTAKMMLTK